MNEAWDSDPSVTQPPNPPSTPTAPTFEHVAAPGAHAGGAFGPTEMGGGGVVGAGGSHRTSHTGRWVVVASVAAICLLLTGFVIRGVVDDPGRDTPREARAQMRSERRERVAERLERRKAERDGSNERDGSDERPNSDSGGRSGAGTVPDDTVEPVPAIAEKLTPAVVQIQTSDGLGSGVVYDESGLILTNAHVVGGAGTVSVSLSDGSRHEGQVLGADGNTDIAVVRINDVDGLTVATLASDPPKVGQMAVALGSPFGLGGTVTTGIVSAVDRPVDNDSGSSVNMIQTDAPINPGNSGGALANRHGEVIGINSSIYSRSGDNSGIGFAVPVATAKSVADRIINGGSLDRAAMGISGSDSPDGEPGAYVHAVLQDGSAARAGLGEGDLITAVDGAPVKDMEGLRAIIGSHAPGDEIAVTYLRNGRTEAVKITLGTLTAGR